MGSRSGEPAETPTLTAKVNAGGDAPGLGDTKPTESIDDPATGDVTEVDDAKPPTLTGSRGLVIGRYVVLGRLGRGGMGAVYRAHDPELDRQIALKLLRVRKAKPSRVALARERLLREAQALAQLSHPNVVSVFDAGTHGDEVFIAMELVEGSTLKEWLRATERTVAEIVDVFVQAGRGLAAAHRAGLIHRDFKPGNVMVGDDGNVRVLDFGLARAAEVGATTFGEHSDSGDGSDVLESAEHRLQAQLTKAGSVMGTPAYMSPEQHLGLEVDALADQFSFCVALYEALYRQRPFSGKEREELKREIVGLRIAEPPADSKVPSWLRRVVVRGLAGRPEDRFGSMQALLDELERDRAAVWRRVGVASAAVVLVAFGVFGFLNVSESERMCRGAEAELASVWDPAVAKRVESRFMASGRPYASGTFRRVARILDRYREDWITMHTQACTATRVRGTQSETMLDRRMQCLNGRREELRALVSLFSAEPDGEIVDRAVRTSLSLTPIAGCADERVLTEAVPPPSNAAARERVKELRARLYRAAALEKAARFKAALPLAKLVFEEASRLGYEPLVLESEFRLASLERNAGSAERAEKLFYSAADRAARSKRDLFHAKAWMELMGIIGHDTARYHEAMALRRVVHAIILRAGDPPALRAQLLASVANIEWVGGRYEAAIAAHRQAIAIRTTSLSAGHPHLAVSYNNLANAFYNQGRYDEARTYYQKALPIWEKALGVDHPDVSMALMNLGNIAAFTGNYDRAKELHERALSIKEKQLGKDHPRVATSLSNMGETLKTRGQWKRSLELQRRAVAIWTKSKGPEHPHTAVGLHNIANTLYAQDEYAQSYRMQRKVLSIFETKLGKNHPFVAHALTGLGKAAHRLGKIEEAVRHLERALRLRESKKVAATELAHTRFSLARALWDGKRHRARALKLARQARADYQRAGKRGRTLGKDVVQWLRKRRKR